MTNGPTNAIETDESTSEYLTASEVEAIEADPVLTVRDVIRWRRDPDR